jgi:glycosyltransferase involved in cell wall biosynthesis
MKVVHLHRMRGIGGSERHLLTLLPALARLGAGPVFVGLDDADWDSQPFYDALEVPYTRVSSPLRLRGALRGADLVHTHLVHADVYGALAAGRTPLVSTKHNDDRFRTGSFRFAERALARRAERVICITESLRRFNVERVGLPPEKLAVVHYGMDAPPAPWGENPSSPVPDSARVVLAIARLEPQKGLDLAVHALAEARREHPDAVLVVLGVGPERAALEALAGELDVPLFLLGRVPDVGAWLRRAELLVHPARWEGFGLALLEAMLSALPVVATPVSSIPEIVVAGETGLLVGPDGLGSAIAHVLGEPELARRLGEAGLARARAEFSVGRMAERTLAVYERR